VLRGQFLTVEIGKVEGSCLPLSLLPSLSSVMPELRDCLAKGMSMHLLATVFDYSIHYGKRI
jgi:hypothetical protein